MFLIKSSKFSSFLVRKKAIVKVLQGKNCFNYNNLLGKPIDALSINVLINSDIELLKIFKYDYGFTWGQSIILGSIVFRGLLSFIKYSIKIFKYKREDERTIIKKGINEVFLNDLNSDIKFYNLNESEAQRLKSYYSPKTLISNFFNAYLIINWFRSLNHMVFHQDQFQYLSSEGFFFIENLTKYDQTWFLGTLIIPLNYLLITTSKHPFLIHLNRKEMKIQRMNLAFMLGLTSYFFPSCYLISYITLASTHLLLNYMYFTYRSLLDRKIVRKYGISKADVTNYKGKTL